MSTVSLIEETEMILDNLSWQSKKVFFNGKSIRRSLLILGVDVYAFPGSPGSLRGQGRNFWVNYQNSLPQILADAHDHWKVKMKACHAVSQSDSMAIKKTMAARKVLILNLAWEQVKMEFADHGYTL